MTALSYDAVKKQAEKLRKTEKVLRDHVAYGSVLATLRGVAPEETDEGLLQVFLGEIVDHYGFCMAWYGRYDREEIRPLVWAGRADRYLDGLVLAIENRQSEHAQCAMSRAVIDGRPFGYGDLARDEGFAPWREYALELGYRSNLALPIQVSGRIEGGIMLYADICHAFPPERVARLSLLAREIGSALHERRLRRASEAALKESEGKYRAVVEKAGDAILILQEGRTIYRNPTWAQLLGYTVEETATHSFLDHVAEEDRERLRRHYEDRLGGLPAPEQYECKLKTRSGRLLNMEARPRLITIGGRPATMVIMRDLTARRKAEEALRESEARFRSIFESARDCIFIKDREMRYELVNPCMEEIFGVKASELIGRADTEVFGEDVAGPVREVDARVLQGEAIEEEQTIHVQGGDRTFHIIKVPVKDSEDRIVGLCGIARDVTERKCAEAALRSYHEKLRSLASQLSLAEERERRRISDHVHDHIGQNLAFSKIRLTELKKQIQEPAQKRAVEEICELISRTIQGTRGLVSELGSPVLYELGFVPAVKALISDIENRGHLSLSFQAEGTDFVLAPDIQVLLYQAVRELLANMVKHAGADSGTVYIGAEKDQVRIVVEDNGVGFDVESLGTASPQSIGYGLFSIRERLEPLGGRVRVTSEPGRGTTVAIMTPRG